MKTRTLFLCKFFSIPERMYQPMIRSHEEHDEYMRIFKLIEGRPGWTKIVAKIDEGDEKLFNVLVDEVCIILLYAV